jgi:hypothetical protein
LATSTETLQTLSWNRDGSFNITLRENGILPTRQWSVYSKLHSMAKAELTAFVGKPSRRSRTRGHYRTTRPGIGLPFSKRSTSWPGSSYQSTGNNFFLTDTKRRHENDKSGITPDGGALGTPQTVDVNGDHAYFVAPLTYTYKQRGKSIKETASFAVALRRTPAGWRITGWAYSKQTLE